MATPRAALAVLLAVLCATVHARPMAPQEVPAPLRTWVPWVLQDLEDHGCPLSNEGTRHCAWPGRLQLDVDGQGARFTLSVEVFKESWVALPGEARLWPQEVTLDAEPVALSEHAGRPALRLPPGRHSLSGRLAWRARPESIPVPPNYALLDLRVDGRTVDQPVLSPEGRLWLQGLGTQTPEGEADRLELEVFRRVVDEIPLQVLTRIELDASGGAREVTLRGALLPDFVPMQLDSPLPARLEADGALRLELRPGRWSLELRSRHPEPLAALSLPEPVAPWPSGEVWVFEARNALRVVEVGGAQVIDPRQTRLPAQWQGLPAWRLAPGATLTLAEQRRGDPEPEPDQLSLERTLWLDFDGGGYTVHDRILGRMTRGWRLESGERLELGRVALDGEPQFITTLGGGRAGVELRRGQVLLEADARISGELARPPATGWDHDFQSASATLQLPPGWRLLAARGVDEAPDAWLAQWTLLDLFLVLLAWVALGRLAGWRGGLLAAVTLALIWHEPGAPRWVWLHLLAAMALLRVLPAGRLRPLVELYRALSLLVLLALALPFAVSQVRNGLYPQLEQPWQATVEEAAPAAAPAPADRGAPEAAAAPDQIMKAEALAVFEGVAEAGPPVAAPPARPQYDPNARLQTGPGLPEWQWHSARLGWNGPLQPDQPLHLVLLSPQGALALAGLRVALLAGLVALMLAPLRSLATGWRTGGPVAALTAVGLALALAAPAPVARAELPDAETLAELGRRLTRPPDCAPACASIARLRADISGERLLLRLEVHALDSVAVPLPGQAAHWLASETLVDGLPAVALERDERGALRLALTPGLHEVTLSGPLPARASFQLPLPLAPRRVEVEAPGWRVQGLGEDGLAEGQLVFTREREAPAAQATLEAATLPGFAQVERTLLLGLDWRVRTVVRRLTPADSGLTLQVPLLEGEAVTTPEVRVAEGKVAVSLAAGQQEFLWDSVLSVRPALTLSAPRTAEWVETWRADVGPTWHAGFTGLPPVHHQDEAERWLPTWRPWPGERLELSLVRPEGVPGRTLTIDRSRLSLTVGERSTEAALALKLRSSQGDRHTLTLPPGAQLQSVAIDGRTEPLRAEGGRLTLPLVPGVQEVDVRWRTAQGASTHLTTPPVGLGAPSVNAHLELALPQDRWTLLVGGPLLGPAVFFWAVLPVLALAAYALGRLSLTPLRARHWLLLGLGLTQTPVLNALVVAGWLLALGLRARLRADTGKLTFNLVQGALVAFSLVALVMLLEGVRAGLLGLPEMQIGGNGSQAYALRWYQDRLTDALPEAWVVSVPLWVYRALMLAWALWLALALPGWLRWGWGCLSAGGLWRPLRLRPDRPAAASPENQGQG